MAMNKEILQFRSLFSPAGSVGAYDSRKPAQIETSPNGTIKADDLGSSAFCEYWISERK